MGRPDGEILALAERSRGLGDLKRVHMGSVSDSVLHHAHCPVLVVGAEEE
jgi:nucleotide-binding universal stress UspA family protein